jgi:AcrR family transcriptional regulator
MSPSDRASTAPPSLPTDLRARRKQRTRSALREAALVLFAERGYEVTTVAQIAALAEVGERTFFVHFPMKEDVLFDVPVEVVEAFGRHIEDAPPGMPDLAAIEEAIVSMNAARVDPVTDHKITQLLVKAATSSPLVRGKQLDYSELLAGEAARALAKRHRERSLSTATVTMAELAIRLLYLIIVEWTTRGPGELETVTRRRFAILREILADPSRF